MLNKLFFPNSDILISTLLAYVTSFVGFLSRPIGGIIFGHYGDRIGRKTVLILTVLIMGIATFLIGLLPTYATAGVWAPLMLLALRIFQGIGIGGEWGGAVLMAVEHSPGGRRGFYGSWPQIGVPAGLLLSAAVVSVLSFLNNDDFFCLGMAHRLPAQRGARRRRRLYPAARSWRRRRSSARKRRTRSPRCRWSSCSAPTPRIRCSGLGARYIEGVTFNIYGVFLIFYLTNTLHMSRQIALTAVMIASAIMIVLLPVCGRLSDRIGRRSLFGIAGLLIGVLSFPAFWLMGTAVADPDDHSRSRCRSASSMRRSMGRKRRCSPNCSTRGCAIPASRSSISSRASSRADSRRSSPRRLLALGGNQPWLICLYILVVSIISAVSVYAMTDRHKADITIEQKVAA